MSCLPEPLEESPSDFIFRAHEPLNPKPLTPEALEALGDRCLGRRISGPYILSRNLCKSRHQTKPCACFLRTLQAFTSSVQTALSNQKTLNPKLKPYSRGSGPENWTTLCRVARGRPLRAAARIAILYGLGFRVKV